MNASNTGSSSITPDGLSEALLFQKWNGDSQVRHIEGQRRRLLEDTRVLRESPGRSSDYDDQTVQQAALGSKNVANCLRLCEIAYSAAPEVILELGTNLGISSSYLALGSERATRTTRLLTGDSSGCRITIARALHENCGFHGITYFEGYFSETFPRMLDLAHKVDLAFVDGDHTYNGTHAYCEGLLRHLAPRGIVIFDDIEWSQGMRAAWAEISARSEWQTAFSLQGVGYAVATQ